MKNTTEQQMTNMGVSNKIGPILKQASEPWYENQHIIANQDQSPLISPTYAKYQNDISNVSNNSIPEMPITALWWKDASVLNINSYSECQEQVAASEFQFLAHPNDQQTKKTSPATELMIKKTRKPKESKKTKKLTENNKTVKRTKHPEKWKVNIKKNARLRGEEYVGVGGKIVPAKVMGPPCNCRMKCSDKIDKATRKELHNVFWKTCTWEQRKQYIALLVKESPKQRTRCRGDTKSDRRQVTFTYSFLIQGDFVTVCKCMFLSTFSVSEKFVRHAMDKKRIAPGGIIGPDQRGRHTPKTKKTEAVKNRVREHIKSFATENSFNSEDCTTKTYLDSKLSIAAMHKLYVLKCKEDGVPESDIVKESYYREMFKTEFNLGFKQPKNKDKKSIQPADVIENNHKIND